MRHIYICDGYLAWCVVFVMMAMMAFRLPSDSSVLGGVEDIVVVLEFFV